MVMRSKTFRQYLADLTTVAVAAGDKVPLLDATNATEASTADASGLGGGGGAIRVEDEGVSTVAAATGINFAGAGVTVTDAGANEALITIPGAGGGATAPVVVSGASDTLAAADNEKVNIYSNAGLVTITLPTDASDDLGDGFECLLVAAGAAGIALSTAGLTLIGSSPATTAAQDESIYVKKTASANTWLVIGPAAGNGANLTWTAATSVIASDTGTDATLTAVDGSNPGLMTSALFTKLNALLRVEDEGTTIVATATGINFAGAGVTVTDAGANEALVTISGGGSGVRVEDEGVSTVAAATGINFVGAGVTVTDAGSNEATVTISGGGSGVRVEDEGVSTVAAATGINFAGAGVTVTDAGSNEALVTIPGGSGGASLGVISAVNVGITRTF